MAKEVEINVNVDTDNAVKSTKNLSDEIKGAIVPTIGLAQAIEFGVESVIEFGKESIKAFKEAEESVNRLSFALTNMGNEGDAALKLLTDQADELEGTSLFDAEAIQATQTQLITSLELTSQEVAALTPQIVELASAQGIDLAQATDQVINGLNGQEKALNKAGVEFKATGDKTKDLNTLLEGLDKFAGASALSLEKNGKGARDLEVGFGKLQEQVGEDLLEAFHSFGDVLFDTENFFNANIATTKALNEQYEIYFGFLNDVTNKILEQGDVQRDLVIANFQRIKQTRDLTTEELKIYTQLLKNQTAQLNAETDRRIDILNKQKEKEDKNSKDKEKKIEKELSDYEKLIIKQKELDTAITNAITSGDVKLANELSLEYKNVSKEIGFIDDQADKAKNGLKELNIITSELKEDQLEDTELDVRKFIPGVGWVTPEKYDLYLAEVDKAKKIQEEINASILEASTILAQAGLDILINSLNAQSEVRLKALDEERTQIDQKYAYEEEKLQNKALGEQLTASQTQTLEAELNAKRIKEQELLDKKEAEIRRKQFNREKTFNLIQAGISGALAIIKAIGSAPPPANIPAIILTSAGVAAQVAVIAASKPPAFADGGLVTGPGTGTSDSINAKLSNGESVINANSTSMFGPLLSAINMAGGGKAFTGSSVVGTSGISTSDNPLIQTPIVKAFVTEVDMTNAQGKARRVDKLSSF